MENSRETAIVNQYETVNYGSFNSSTDYLVPSQVLLKSPERATPARRSPLKTAAQSSVMPIEDQETPLKTSTPNVASQRKDTCIQWRSVGRFEEG